MDVTRKCNTYENKNDDSFVTFFLFSSFSLALLYIMALHVISLPFIIVPLIYHDSIPGQMIVFGRTA